MVSEINKQDYLLYEATGTAVATDAMLNFNGPGIKKSGSPNIPLYSQMPDWKRISVEVINTTHAAGSINVAGYTSNNVGSVLSSSNAIAVDGDGASAFESGAIAGNATPPSPTMFTMVREEAASCSNIGALLGFLLDVTGATWTGKVIVCVTR